MYKTKLLIIIFSLISLFCYSKELHGNKIGKSDTITNIEEAALSFYKWYLPIVNTIELTVPSNADVKENSDGMCKLDFAPYFTELRKLGSISEKFLENEVKRLSHCEEYISTISYHTYINANHNIFHSHCSQLYINYWGGQGHDSPGNNIIALQTIIDENEVSAYVDAAFYFSDDHSINNTIPNSPQVRIYLEQEPINTWKIIKILFWDNNKLVQHKS